MATASADAVPRPSSTPSRAAVGLAAFCRRVPYAVVAVGLRLVIARVFFMAGQEKVTGPEIRIPLAGLAEDLRVILPAEIKPAVFELFQQYPNLPMPSAVAAYVFTFAEFLFPVCLILGFATRLSALALAAITAMIQAYMAPEAFWTAHVYLFAILAVLVTVGPGGISLDALVRFLMRK